VPQRLSEAGALHQALVDELKLKGLIRSPSVEAAFRAIPRHPFLPDRPIDQVYLDEAVPTKHFDGQVVSSSSAPAIMAIMLEQLQLERGHRVLEIGAGTGYNAALMAQVVGASGKVVTLDIDGDLVDSARAHLSAVGVAGVEVVCADGAFGWPAAVPYDRIILTAAAEDVVPAWRDQLRPGGRLVLPLHLKRGLTKSVALERCNGHLASLTVRDCGFMPLRGYLAGHNVPEAVATVFLDDSSSASETFRTALLQDSRTTLTGARVASYELRNLTFWIALRTANSCQLRARVSGPAERLLPDLEQLEVRFLGALGTQPAQHRFPEGQNYFHSSVGLFRDTAVSLLARPPDSDGWSFDLLVTTFGQDSTLGEDLVAEVRAWDRAGRPSVESLSIRVYSATDPYVPSASERMIRKVFSTLVLRWPGASYNAG
jgi:protein-L-isoaspartate(D-aspartate) O-methyltransferase